MGKDTNTRPWIEARLEENVLLTTVEQAIHWGRQSSVRPMTFGLACCAIEMMVTGADRCGISKLPARGVKVDDQLSLPHHKGYVAPPPSPEPLRSHQEIDD